MLIRHENENDNDNEDRILLLMMTGNGWLVGVVSPVVRFWRHVVRSDVLWSTVR